MTIPRDGVVQITSVTRTVPDIEAAARFYQDALGSTVNQPLAELSVTECALLGVASGQVLSQGMSVGSQHLTLLQFAPQGRSYPPESTSTDLWFQHCAVVVGDMERAYVQVMRAHATPISERPQRLPANTGGVTAFKFRDPFGHPWELLELPKEVGDQAWHRPNSDLFLGIDHTAIAVSHLRPSCRFYTEIAALVVVDRTRNRGEEQTRLDAVPADDVDVVALTPTASPPHLELLGYRTGSRRHLTSADPADSVVSRTIAAGCVAGLAERLARGGHALRHGTWDDRDAISFRDPDGHTWICHEV